MFKHLFLSILFFLACGCGNNFTEHYFFELLKPTTHIKLYCFKNNDTSVTLISSPASISGLKKLINGKTEELKPEKISGKLIFYDHDKKIITATLTPSGCYYTYGNCSYKTRLSYKTGMHLEESCYSAFD